MNRYRWHVIMGFLILGLGLVGSAQQRRDEDQPRQSEPDLPKTEPGKIIRDEPTALRVEDMTDPELQERLAQYEAGKRGYRDGYIIANQLWFNFGVRRATSSPEAQRIRHLRESLLQRFPELMNLSDFRLSEKIKYDKAREAEASAAAVLRAKWKPWDKKPLRIYVSGNQAAVSYQYRIEFLNLPPDVKLKKDTSNADVLIRGDTRVDPESLTVKKRWTFKHPFDMFPARDNQHFLVCTGFAATDYLVLDEEESRIVGETRVRWQNKEGQIDDFCGVASINGDIVYKFPFKQRSPKNLIAPLAISDDGQYAAITIGEEVDGEDGKIVANPREVWTWEYPSTLKKFPGPWKNGAPRDAFKAIDDMRRQFRRKPKP